jgi:hypothetical protein
MKAYCYTAKPAVELNQQAVRRGKGSSRAPAPYTTVDPLQTQSTHLHNPDLLTDCSLVQSKNSNDIVLQLIQLCPTTPHNNHVQFNRTAQHAKHAPSLEGAA